MSSLRIFQSIEEIDPHEWDSLVHDQVPMCYGWLKTVEQTFLGNLSPYYLILYEDDRPVAASAYRVLKFNCTFSQIKIFFLEGWSHFFPYSAKRNQVTGRARVDELQPQPAQFAPLSLDGHGYDALVVSTAATLKLASNPTLSCVRYGHTYRLLEDCG